MKLIGEFITQLETPQAFWAFVYKMAARGHFVFPIYAKNDKVLVIWELNGYYYMANMNLIGVFVTKLSRKDTQTLPQRWRKTCMKTSPQHYGNIHFWRKTVLDLDLYLFILYGLYFPYICIFQFIPSVSVVQ